MNLVKFLKSHTVNGHLLPDKMLREKIVKKFQNDKRALKVKDSKDGTVAILPELKFCH